MAKLIAAPNLQLPWSSSKQDDSRFWVIGLVLFVLFFILSVIITRIEVPEPDRDELEEKAIELAQVILEKQEIPEPPPPPPKEEEKKEEEKPKEEPEPEKEPEPEPEPEPKPEPKPEPEEVKLVEAKEAAAAELNQFADMLSDMREDTVDLSDATNDQLVQGTGEEEKLDRALIGASASSKSSGINTENLSRDVGGTTLSGKESTRVTSKIATATGTGDKATAEEVVREKSRRSDEEIRSVMDKNKALIFNVYNKALRKNPTLEGKVVFKIVIDPTGKVVDAEIVSSELNDADLEKKLLGRIRLINFGTRDVLRTTVNYSLDFLPY